MTLRRQRQMLWAASGLLALAVVAAAGGLAAWPIDTFDGAAAGNPAARDDPGTGTTPARLSLSAYAGLWQRDLQRPLYDPSPVAAKPAPPPKLTVTLVGTVIEEGFTYTLLRTKAGQVKMASVGQTVDGAEVLAITGNSATVRFAGAEHVMRIEKERKGS